MPAIRNASRNPLVLPDGRGLPIGAVTNVPDEAWRLYRGHVVVQAWLSAGKIMIVGDEPSPMPEPVKPAAVPETLPDEPAGDDFDPLEALRDVARELGVTVDRRWGEARLRREIDEARASQE